MSNIEDIVYDGEKINIGGKERKLLFTLEGMKILAKEFGTVEILAGNARIKL